MELNRRLLVVDDDAGVRAAYTEILRPPVSGPSPLALLASSVLGIPSEPLLKVGHQPFITEQADSGQAAAGRLQELLAAGTPPAVAFVDMRMPPGWDGLTTIEALWRLDPRLQCVICTAYSDHSWEQIVARLGATDRLLILKKPFDRMEVLQLAESLCAKWSVAREAELRAAEVALHQARLAGIIDGAQAAISLKNAAGEYLLVNRSFCQRYAVDGRQAVGSSDGELFPEVAATLAQREAAPPAPGDGGEDDPRLAAERRFLNVRFPIEGPDGGSEQCTISSEITELRRLQDQMRQTQRLESLGRLAGGVAHDFNNLLSAIIGFSEMALLRLPAGQAARPQLEQVVKVGLQAAELTKQLLAFSRSQVLRPQVVEVAAAVAADVALLRRLLSENVELRTASSGDTRVFIDPGQLQQVVMNLVLNARDAMPAGGMVTVRCEGAGGMVRLVVADSGPGIPPEIASRIFDPFFTTKAPGIGTGLGLATVHGIVLQSGGSIRVDSTPGQGAVFTVELPHHAGPPVAPLPVQQAHPGQGERILVVDDRDDVLDLASAFLRDAGYRVESGCDALALAEQAEAKGVPYDLLLTDVVMPRLGGVDLAARLRRRQPQLRVLYMTGWPDRPDALDGPILTKPFRHDDLLRAVRSALA